VMLEGGYEAFETRARLGPAAKALATTHAENPQPKVVAKAPPPPAPSPAIVDRDEAKRRDKRAREAANAEREVARLDEKRAVLEREFADPAIYDDRDRVATLEAELAAARAAVDAAFARWEALAEAVVA